MSFGHHHHHHQPPPCVEEVYATEVYEGERIYAPPAPAAYPGSYERASSGCYERPAAGIVYPNSATNYKRNEHLGELGAVAAGAFALYEGHKAKTDVEHASRHKLEEEAAAVGALGSTGYAYYEHRQKNKFEDGRW